MTTIPPIVKILHNIDDTEQFSEELANYVNRLISFDDVEGVAAEPNTLTKEIYFMFFLGALLATKYEFEINTKQEPGKPDILLKTPWYHAIFEIMVVDSETDEMMQNGIEETIKQIDEKGYWKELGHLPLPIYKIGIACHGKKCLVKTVLH